MIKVSVIIPIYNCEKYIEESLTSLFVQNYQEFEIIVVNDGSTDNTFQIASNVLKFSPVAYKIIDHNDNEGISSRRTEAVRASNREYIALHDGDDVSLPYRLEKQVKFMEKNDDISFLGGFAKKINEESVEIEGIMDYPPEMHFDIIDMIVKRNMNPMLDPTMMFRKKAFEELGEYSLKKDRRLVPDFDLCLRAILKGYKFCNLQEPLVKYRVNREGNTLKHKKEMIRQHVIVWREFLTKYRTI